MTNRNIHIVNKILSGNQPANKAISTAEFINKIYEKGSQFRESKNEILRNNLKREDEIGVTTSLSMIDMDVVIYDNSEFEDHKLDNNQLNSLNNLEVNFDNSTNALWKQILKFVSVVSVSLFLINYTANAARIKDIATIEGAGSVQVIGYGLVSGLNNSGDNQQTSFTVQSVSNMLKRFGLTPPLRNPRIRNVAAVMVTSTIPAFMKKGTKVDVQVSSIGDATSLQGGVLLMAPISLSDGTIVGFGQGPLAVGGYDAQSLGSRLSKNSATTARVPGGLILEQDISSTFIQNQILRISLREPDFTTSIRISDAINNAPGLANTATPLDAGTVQVQFPVGQTQQQIMQSIAQIEALNVISDPNARVVINERTGTVVVGANVQLLPSVIAHSGLEITIQKQVVIPQPVPFVIRPPQPVETAEINAQEELRESIPLVVQGATVQDMANALNLLKVNPRDLIAIFQALKEAGVLQGELIIQ